MEKIEVHTYKTKIWEIFVSSFKWKICMFNFKKNKRTNTYINRLKTELKTDIVEKENSIIIKAKEEFEQYISWNRKDFSLPIFTIWSSFQKKVWENIWKIKYGEKISYLDLAKKINNKKAIRAVGTACWANPIIVMIPCHRIIWSSWWLWGYSWWLEIKKLLLDLEESKK